MIREALIYVQLPPPATDFKGSTIFISFRLIFVIANIEIKQKVFKGLKIYSVTGRFSLLVGSFERVSTVFMLDKQ